MAAEVEENLCADLVGDILEASLEVGLGGGASGLSVGGGNELESLGSVEFLQRCYSIFLSYLDVVLDFVRSGSVLLDDNLMGGVEGLSLELALECDLGVTVGVSFALLRGGADLL